MVKSRRVLKAAEAVREVVSMAILTDLRDPRVDHVTVTYVEVSPDMRHAKVHVSVMGDEKRQERCLKGLQNSAGFLQGKVANRIDTRYTPRLEFVLDKGVKNAAAVAEILRQVLPSSEHDSDLEADDDSPLQDVDTPDSPLTAEEQTSSEDASSDDNPHA